MQVNRIYFKSIMYHDITFRFDIYPGDIEYEDEVCTVEYHFREKTISYVCDWIKNRLIELGASYKDVRYVCSGETYNMINKKTLNSAFTVKELFAQEGINIEEG